MKTNRMYYEFAHLWPLISPPEHYASEAHFWRDTLKEYLGTGRKWLLELGVGGGHNLSHLTKDFRAEAVDLSPGMLENSMRLNPDVQHHVGDMRSIRLGRAFDAVIVHDAISYMLTEQDLTDTFQTAKAHLSEGGVFLASPDWLKETFPGLYTSSFTQSGQGVELTYFEYCHDPDSEDTTMETYFTYFIKERGDLKVEQDLHITGLFAMDTWTSLMDKSGFRVEHRVDLTRDDPQGANLFVGVYK